MAESKSFRNFLSFSEFVFDKSSADLLFLKQTEVLSVLKGDFVPIQEFIDKATFDSVQ